MTFETILFDLDDTLLDRNKSLCNFIDLFKLNFSSIMNYPSIVELKDIMLEIDFHGYRPREEMFSELLERVSWKLKPDIESLLRFWNEEFPKCAEPMGNMYVVLDHLLLKGIKMGIVTNGSTLFQNTKTDKLDLRKYMKAIVISEEAGIRKPDPGIFYIALSKTGSRKETTLFIGDNPETDIKGAINAGLTSVWLSGGKTWDESGYRPDFVIESFSGISGLGME